ncbi:MAG: response regulator transcription factor [Candidatus Peregrinibacteria bacterium]
MYTILLVEDNPRLSKNIIDFLELEHFKVESARDGQMGLEKARSTEVGLIILDRNLPLLNGMDICVQLRAEAIATPILMLTAQSDTPEKVEGLNAGADDYLGKPFQFEELLARIRALLRRNVPQKSEAFTLGDMVVNILTHEIKRAGKSVSLAPKEFSILEFLLRHKGRPKNRGEILEAVWGESEADILFDSDTIEVHIASIRRKIGKDKIETIRGIGYKIADIPS